MLKPEFEAKLTNPFVEIDNVLAELEDEVILHAPSRVVMATRLENLANAANNLFKENEVIFASFAAINSEEERKELAIQEAWSFNRPFECRSSSINLGVHKGESLYIETVVKGLGIDKALRKSIEDVMQHLGLGENKVQNPAVNRQRMLFQGNVPTEIDGLSLLVYVERVSLEFESLGYLSAIYPQLTPDAILRVAISDQRLRDFSEHAINRPLVTF